MQKSQYTFRVLELQIFIFKKYFILIYVTECFSSMYISTPLVLLMLVKELELNREPPEK